MPGPCRLDSIQLLCGSGVYNHGVFLNARVYACHTTVEELDSAFADNYAGNTPQAAMTRDTLALSWTNGEWQGLEFDSPFSYNGSDNLVLESRWQGDDGGSVYNLGYHTSGNRAVDGKSPTAEYGTPRNYMPRFRIYYSTTSIAEGRFPAAGEGVVAAPNPFTTHTAVRLLPAAGDDAGVRIYDASGALVRSLRQSSVLRWDGRDQAGCRVRSGTYFLRASRGDRCETLHLVLRD